MPKEKSKKKHTTVAEQPYGADKLDVEIVDVKDVIPKHLLVKQNRFNFLQVEDRCDVDEEVHEMDPYAPKFSALSAEEASVSPSFFLFIFVVVQSHLNCKGGRIEHRRVVVPQHRLTPLRNAWEKIYEPLVKHMKLEVRMNTKTRNVELRVPSFSQCFQSPFHTRHVREPKTTVRCRKELIL